MPQFICVSYERWDDGTQRIHHLFEGIPNLSMLYFEPAQPLLSRLRRPAEGTNVAEGVMAYTLPSSIPTTEEARVRITKRSRKNAAFIRRIMQENGFESPVLWLRSPDQVELLYELHLSRVVYDCDRTWREYPPEWEYTLVQEAGLVLCAGPVLHDRMRMYNDNAVFLPNGVDLARFRHAGEPLELLPADLEKLAQKGHILGYLGDVGDFTQLTPVLHAAAEHPDWSFVFVGKTAPNNPDVHRCRRKKNIHFLGEKSPVSLQRYLAGFDLCISLSDDRQPDPAVVPEQLYRYLASGKPIIATSKGQLSVNYPDVIFYAADAEEFTASCELALEREPLHAARQRMDYAVEAQWPRRQAHLRELLRANGFM